MFLILIGQETLGHAFSCQGLSYDICSAIETSNIFIFKICNIIVVGVVRLEDVKHCLQYCSFCIIKTAIYQNRLTQDRLASYLKQFNLILHLFFFSNFTRCLEKNKF